MYPYVSILISTKNRRDGLNKLIDSLGKLQYPHNRFEIVIIEETDTPLPVKRDTLDIQYIPIPVYHKGFGYTRNVALENARYDIIAFTDDDCRVDANWLNNLIAPLVSDDVAGSGGAVITDGDDFLSRCETTLGFPSGGIYRQYLSLGKIIPCKYLVTSNCAYKKEIVWKVGGFEVSLIYSGEDTILSEKISKNHKCVYVPSAIVYHKPRGGILNIFNWFIRRGRSDIDVMYKMNESRLVRVKRSIIAKFLLFILSAWILGLSFPESILIFLTLYWIKTMYDRRHCIKIFHSYIFWLFLPSVKLLMDIAFDIGRILQVYNRRGL